MNTELILELDKGLDEYFLGPFHLNEQRIKAEDPAAYIGLETAALMTSYVDYYSVLEDIPKEETLVDLGAGYGRGSFLSHKLGLAECISIEFVKDRVEYAMSQYKGGDQFICADLMDYVIPKAYGYYLYFPKGKVFNAIIRQLVDIGQKRESYLYVCESHGDVIDYLNQFPRIFSLTKEIELSLPRHHNYINKYRINNYSKLELSLSEFYLVKDISNYSFVVKTEDKVTNNLYEWKLPLKDHELILYNGNFSLQHYQTNRIVEIYRDEPVIRLEEGQSPSKVLIHNSVVNKSE